MAVFCILSLVLPGCSKKQVLVSAPPQEGKNIYHKSSPKSLSDQIRSVFKVSEINRWAERQADNRELLERYPEIAPTLAQVEKDPTDLGAKRRLAQFYSEKKLYRRALEQYTELAVQLPEDAEIQLTLGQIWDYKGAYAIALRHTINAVEINPESIPANTLLGMVYLHREEPKQAVAAFQNVLQLDPENGPVLANLGYAYLQLKEWQKASEYLEDAVQRSSDSARVRNNLGIAKAYLGDEEGALKEFLKVSQPAVAYNNLGAAYLAIEDWSKARDAFEQALAWDSSYVKARLNLIEAESYLPPPSTVDLTPYDSRLASLQTSWKEYFGIARQNIIDLPKQQLFSSSETFPFPLQRLGFPLQSAASSLSAQLLDERPGEQSSPLPSENPAPSPFVQPNQADPISLAELAPLAFTVENEVTDAPVSVGAEKQLATMTTEADGPPSGVRLPSPVEMADLSSLLTHVITDPVPTLGSKSRSSGQSIDKLKIAGGELLEMLVRQPSLDWTAVAQTPDASYEGNLALADKPVSMATQDHQVAYPAQVWLVTPMPAPRLPFLGLPQQKVITPQPMAMNRVVFPPQDMAGRTNEEDESQAQVRAQSPLAQLDQPAGKQDERTDDQALAAHRTEIPETASPTAGPSLQVPKSTSLDSYPAPSFDQFTAIRDEVVNSQAERTDETETQSAGISSRVPLEPSGLAGLAGAALILLSLGTTRLYMRWRSPLRSPGKSESDEE